MKNDEGGNVDIGLIYLFIIVNNNPRLLRDYK